MTCETARSFEGELWANTSARLAVLDSRNVEQFLRWLGFTAGIVILVGTVVAVMKTLLVPRRSWSLLSAFVGRYGFRAFHSVAIRMSSYDLADRFLGFLAPTVVIGILAALLASFVVAFALLLLPWADLTIGEALLESGSSIFTLGFLSTAGPVPITIDVLGGATGMIFVALTIGYLPPMYAEIRRREALVKQLGVWTGTPSWGPEILARFSLAGAVGRLPRLYSSWDGWCAHVADTHMKYPALTHFRLPRSRNHWLIALLGVMDSAALDMALRPSSDHIDARLMLRQGASCLRDVAYPIRRIEPGPPEPGIDEADFHRGVDRLISAGFPVERSAGEAWQEFVAIRSDYAPLAYQLAFWTMAAPAPWSGERAGFPGLIDEPDAPDIWSLT